MNIKDKIEDLVERIKSDDALRARFLKDPVSAVEELLGVDLPNDQLDSIVEGVKAKIKLDDIGGKLDGLGDKLGSFLGK